MALHSVHIFAGAVQVFGRKLTAGGQIPENIAEDILTATVFVIGIGPVPAANLRHGITARNGEFVRNEVDLRSRLPTVHRHSLNTPRIVRIGCKIQSDAR